MIQRQWLISRSQLRAMKCGLTQERNFTVKPRIKNAYLCEEDQLALSSIINSEQNDVNLGNNWDYKKIDKNLK